jgi:hypothetical protein
MPSRIKNSKEIGTTRAREKGVMTFSSITHWDVKVEQPLK